MRKQSPHAATDAPVIARGGTRDPGARALGVARYAGRSTGSIDAGHFVWEEAPAEYASSILDAIARYST
jgi:pimeloyl-ACP methyl ester carboxylesterase